MPVANARELRLQGHPQEAETPAFARARSRMAAASSSTVERMQNAGLRAVAPKAQPWRPC